MHRVSSIVLAFSLATHLPAIAWSLPPPRGITIRDLIPLVSWQKQFQITEGKDRGRVVSLISQPNPADEKRWTLVFGDYAGVLLVKNPNGALMMERLDLFKAAATSSMSRRYRFSPVISTYRRPFGFRRATRCTIEKLASSSAPAK